MYLTLSFVCHEGFWQHHLAISQSSPSSGTRKPLACLRRCTGSGRYVDVQCSERNELQRKRPDSLTMSTRQTKRNRGHEYSAAVSRIPQPPATELEQAT